VATCSLMPSPMATAQSMATSRAARATQRAWISKPSMKVSNRILTALFVASGMLHLFNPSAFEWLMPPWLPQHTILIYVSGVFELVCAGGLILGQRWAGWLAALVLLAVWPANIWFAFNVAGSGNLWLIVAAWVRLPLQVPLMYFAWKYSQRKTL